MFIHPLHTHRKFCHPLGKSVQKYIIKRNLLFFCKFKDDIDLNEHLRYLNWSNDQDLSDENDDDDDDTTSIDSEIFGRPFNNDNNRHSPEKTMEDESWV
jgi:hypothetical protein